MKFEDWYGTDERGKFAPSHLKRTTASNGSRKGKAVAHAQTNEEMRDGVIKSAWFRLASLPKSERKARMAKHKIPSKIRCQKVTTKSPLLKHVQNRGRA